LCISGEQYLKENKLYEFGVHFDSLQEVFGFQFDLLYPSSWEFQNAELLRCKTSDNIQEMFDEKTGTHTLMVNEMAQGRVRFLCFSIPKTPFTGQEGALMNIKFKTTSKTAKAAIQFTKASVVGVQNNKNVNIWKGNQTHWTIVE
jgi:hypothetical protein